jgi:N-acyl-L-homoserine lactone synthetase
VILFLEHWIMDLLKEKLQLKTNGRTKSQMLKAYRQYRREIFNRQKEWYPVLEDGKSFAENSSI